MTNEIMKKYNKLLHYTLINCENLFTFWLSLGRTTYVDIILSSDVYKASDPGNTIKA